MNVIMNAIMTYIRVGLVTAMTQTRRGWTAKRGGTGPSLLGVQPMVHGSLVPGHWYPARASSDSSATGSWLPWLIRVGFVTSVTHPRPPFEFFFWRESVQFVGDTICSAAWQATFVGKTWNFEFAAGSGKLQHESKIHNIGPLLMIHFVLYLIDTFRTVFDRYCIWLISPMVFGTDKDMMSIWIDGQENSGRQQPAK